jgi:hypothetical protein
MLRAMLQVCCVEQMGAYVVGTNAGWPPQPSYDFFGLEPPPRVDPYLRNLADDLLAQRLGLSAQRSMEIVEKP